MFIAASRSLTIRNYRCLKDPDDGAEPLVLLTLKCAFVNESNCALAWAVAHPSSFDIRKLWDATTENQKDNARRLAKSMTVGPNRCPEDKAFGRPLYPVAPVSLNVEALKEGETVLLPKISLTLPSMTEGDESGPGHRSPIVSLLDVLRFDVASTLCSKGNLRDLQCHCHLPMNKRSPIRL